MYCSHANQQRNYTGKRHPVFLEQPLCPNKPPAYSNYYNQRRENRAPPTYQQSRFILREDSGRRRGRVDAHIDSNCHARLPPQRGRARSLVNSQEVFQNRQLIAFLSGLLDNGRRCLRGSWGINCGMTGLEGLSVAWSHRGYDVPEALKERCSEDSPRAPVPCVRQCVIGGQRAQIRMTIGLLDSVSKARRANGSQKIIIIKEGRLTARWNCNSRW